MKQPGFIGPSYTLRTVNYECQRTINMFMESDEVSSGGMPTAKEKEPAMLVSVPGQDPIIKMPKAPVRGLYYTAFGYIVCVAGNTIYYLNTPDHGVTWTAPTPIAELTTSTGPVCIVDGIPNKYNGLANTGDINLVVVVDGSNYGVVFQEGTTSAIQLNSGNAYNGASFVTFQDGFFLFTQNVQSPTCFFASDPINIDDTDIVTVNLGSDYISRVISDHDIIWIMGGRSSSVWQNTGQSGASNTFQQIPGSYSEGGCAFPHTIAKVGGQLLWVASDDRGHGQVFMAQGYRGVRISNHAVEGWLQSFDTLVGATAWTYQDQGHSFYILNVPGSTTTWAYDLTEHMWAERAFYKNGVFSRDLAETHCMLGSNFNGLHLVGDYQTNTIYSLSDEVYVLNGEPIYRMRTAPHGSSSLKRVFFSQAQLDLETGVGLDGLGFPYSMGPDYSQPEETITMTNANLNQIDNGLYEFLDQDGQPVTPTTVTSIDATGQWSNLYNVSGDQVQILPTNFNISESQFGTGNGSLQNFTFTSGGLAAGTTLNSANIFNSDWKGHNLQSTTAVQNEVLDSQNFADTSVWTLQGTTTDSTGWTQYPTLNQKIYRPSQVNPNQYPSPYPATNPNGAFSSTKSTLDTTNTGSGCMSATSPHGTVSVVYNGFGNALNVSGTLWVSAYNNTNLETTNSFLEIGYTLDDTVDNTVVWQNFMLGGSSSGKPSDISWEVPGSVHITIPDMSKFSVQVFANSSGNSGVISKCGDIVFISDAQVADGPINQNAPDGSNTGTYLVEDKTFSNHGITTNFNVPTAGVPYTSSFYYQIADGSRSAQAFILGPQISFQGHILGNTLTVDIPPTTGSLATGMYLSCLSGELRTLYTSIIGGSGSTWTISQTIPGGTSAKLSATQVMYAQTLDVTTEFPNTGIPIVSGSMTPVGSCWLGSITGNQLSINSIYAGAPTIGQTISALGLPTGATIISGSGSNWIISTTLPTPITNNIFYVVSGDTPTNIYRCHQTWVPTATGQHTLIISNYNPDVGKHLQYAGNGGSEIGVWGAMVAQTPSMTPYVQSISGVAGSDFITPTLSSGTVVYNIAPVNDAQLSWTGTATGDSIFPVTYFATYQYQQYPPLVVYLGLNPMVNLSWSDDGGHSWSPEISVPIGTLGSYTGRVIWRRLGMSRDRVFRVTCSEPVKFNIVGAEFKAKEGEING